MSDLAIPPLSEAARTPLYDLHCALGARMVGFAGYAMPLQYPAGIIAEHLHVRAEAGLFDVSHMGQALLEGPRAARRLETLVPADVATLAPGRMRYTQFLDAGGHILDDLMVTRLPDDGGDERLSLVVNAGTKAADFAHLAEQLPDLALTIETDRALLALQGPRSAEVLARHFPGVAEMPFLSASVLASDAIEVKITRSGYTGEDGFEISLAAEVAMAFAEKLLAEPEVRPIGLGARDSLRLEAGLCLHGHDIDRTTDPVEASLLWSIPQHRRAEGGFLGADHLRDVIGTGPGRRRVGFLIEDKAIAREGAIVTTPGGDSIGVVTSGGFSPCLGRPIAMGYVAAGHAVPGTPVRLLARGKSLEARVAALPFVPHQYFRGS
jgi:aminomethyltransferase